MVTGGRKRSFTDSFPKWSVVAMFQVPYNSKPLAGDLAMARISLLKTQLPIEKSRK